MQRLDRIDRLAHLVRRGIRRPCAWRTVLIPLALIAATAQADEPPPRPGDAIARVLADSHDRRLAALPRADADGPRAAVIRGSFESVLARLASPPELRLVIIRGDTVAETVHGRIIVANESLADLPEGVRCFVLAHEIGHAVLGHWPQLGALYRK